jgi:hypothetical protein
MSVKAVALAVLAVTGAALLASEPAFPAGGVRALPAARRIAPPMVRPHARAGILRASPRFQFAHSSGVRAIRHARAQFRIPPSPQGFAVTTPLRPFAQLTRRSHRIYRSGWYFPFTYGGDLGYSGYIGVPYDPAETIPVYGPAPAFDDVDPPPPPPAAAAPATARVSNTSDENRDACRSERVTVPASEGERTITVVRC